MSKEDIDKLDKQIELLKKDKDNKPTGAVETVVTEIHDKNDPNHVINIDYIDSEVSESTKKLEDLKTLTAEVEEVTEDTKKITVTENKDAIVEPEVEEIPTKVEEIKNKPKSNKTLFIILWVIIGVLVLIFIVCLCLVGGKDKKEELTSKGDSDDEITKVLSVADMKKMVDLYGKTLESEVTKYFNSNNKLPDFSTVNNLVDLDHEVVCYIHDIYDDKTVYLDECMVDYKDVDYSYGTKKEKTVEEVDNNNIKVYVNKSTKVATLVEPNDKSNYILYSSNVDGAIDNIKLIDGTSYLVYYDNNSSVYTGFVYNYITGKKAFYNMEHLKVVPIMSKSSADKYLRYVAVYTEEFKAKIYDLVSGEAISEQYHEIGNMELTDNRITVGKSKKYGMMNLKTGSLLIPIEYDFVGCSGNVCTAMKDKKKFIFDEDGNQYLTDLSKDGFEQAAVNDKYVLYENKLYNITGKKLCDLELDDSRVIKYTFTTSDYVVYNLSENGQNKCLVYNIGKKECAITSAEDCPKP